MHGSVGSRCCLQPPHLPPTHPHPTQRQVITGAIPRGADRVPLGRPDHNVHCYISTYPGEDGEPEGEKFVPRVS